MSRSKRLAAALVALAFFACDARADAPARLDEARLQSFAELSLKCVSQEYANKPNLTLDSASDLKQNRELHPAFYGCFDWHSAVHGHWALVRILELSRDEKFKERVARALDRDFQPEKIAAEVRYFTDGSAAERFERPYGYGWLLRLALELRGLKHPKAAGWSKTLEPLEKRVRELYFKTFERFDFPVRVGLHENFAFSMAHAYDYAKGVGDSELLEAIRTHAVRYYGRDERCPIAYEPSGEDFLSPCLAEAEVMARVLEPAEFRKWLRAFLDPRSLPHFLEPISPTAQALKDPRTVHLVGLNFQKSWALRRIAGALPKDALRAKLLAAADAHRARSTELMFRSDYGGTHWLASFALFDWTAN